MIKNVPLTENLFYLILALQAQQKLVYYIGNATGTFGNSRKVTEELFNKTQWQAPIPKNSYNFDFLLRYEITEKMRNTTFVDLPKKYSINLWFNEEEHLESIHA